MDFSDYFKRNKAREISSKISGIEKKCLCCGKALQNQGNYLYYRRLCSEDCKEIYCSSNDY